MKSGKRGSDDTDTSANFRFLHCSKGLKEANL
jgi:hypothetical protein